MVERDGTDRIICRCVDSEGIVCAGTFKNHRALWDHLKNVPTRTWLVCQNISIEYLSSNWTIRSLHQLRRLTLQKRKGIFPLK